MDRIAEVKNRNGGRADRAVEVADRMIEMTDRAVSRMWDGSFKMREWDFLTILCFYIFKKRACKIHEICIYCI
ncbi:hypothetical protein QUF87_12440 [Lysinibacillus pakistanensis]|nr:hypothetical protein [Lysinibacillus pakistanensis]